MCDYATNRAESVICLHSKMTIYQNNITGRLGSQVRGHGVKVSLTPVHLGSLSIATTLAMVLTATR